MLDRRSQYLFDLDSTSNYSLSALHAHSKVSTGDIDRPLCALAGLPGERLPSLSNGAYREELMSAQRQRKSKDSP